MNNYDNAEPKPLKFLVSDGKLVDESGNIIAESDSLQDLYIKSSPQVKKYLLSDGSVVDENNNLIIKNDYYKKVYDQATPKVAKYLHSDGTIDENSGGGSGSKPKAFCWKKGAEKFYFNFDKAVAEKSDFENSKILVKRFVEFQKQNSGVTAVIYSSVYSADVGLFVAIGNKKLLTSTNGINWTDRTPTLLLNITMEQIIYLSNELKRFVMVSSGGGVYLSSNGIAWERMNTGVSGYLYSLTYSETLNLVVAVGASGVILTSSDGGIHWDNQTNPVSTSLRSIIYSKRLNLFVAVGDEGVILTSPDGENWTKQTNTNSTRLNSIAYNSELNLFVAVGGNSGSTPNTTVILTSPDGINWTQQTSGVSNIAWLSITYSSELNVFMVVGGSGAILTSPDGINWTQQTSGVSSRLNSIVYSSELDLFIAVGESGVILTSRINQKIISNIQNYFGVVNNYVKNSDSEFALQSLLQAGTFERSSNDDLEFWN